MKVHFPYNSKPTPTFSRPSSCKTTYFRKSSKTSIEEALINRIEECKKGWSKKETPAPKTNKITPLINRPLMSKEMWLTQKSNNKHVNSKNKSK